MTGRRLSFSWEEDFSASRSCGGLVRGFSGRWPWGTPTGVAGPSWSIRQSMKAPTDALPGSAREPVENASPDETSRGKWVVYLTGEIASPGILEISPDSRLYQAVEAAGGLTARADKDGINLAEKLSDGIHVHIPAIGEKPVKEGILPGSGKVPPSNNGGLQSGSSLPIDINRATALEIEALPGIGPKLAQQIVEDRTGNGPFRSPEDLLRVKGIGQAKLEKIKELVIVRP
jgi:competence protein ComEA helix-hairpin-helix repeat region